MFIAALFTIARPWKQPKCPSTEERIKNIGPHGDFLGRPVVKNLPGNAGAKGGTVTPGGELSQGDLGPPPSNLNVA